MPLINVVDIQIEVVEIAIVIEYDLALFGAFLGDCRQTRFGIGILRIFI